MVQYYYPLLQNARSREKHFTFRCIECDYLLNVLWLGCTECEGITKVTDETKTNLIIKCVYCKNRMIYDSLLTEKRNDW